MTFNTFTNGTAADATEVNANFLHIVQNIQPYLYSLSGSTASTSYVTVRDINMVTLDVAVYGFKYNLTLYNFSHCI